MLTMVAVAASCSSTAATTTSPPVEGATSTTATSPGAEPSDSATSTVPESDTTPDLTVFIASIDEAMVGTGYEGAAIEDPEVFIAVGQLFCERLDDGDSQDDVLSEYLDGVADAEGVVSDDDATLAGVVLGVSIEVLCPEHA